MDTRRTEQMFASAEPPEAAAGPAPHEVREGYDERFNHILHAATIAFARQGYQKASMRAVAKISGVSLAGLYHYFDSKDKMLFLIQFRAFSSLLSTLKEKLHGVGDPVEQLRVMVKAHVSYFAANMAALKVCSHELDSLQGPAYEQLRKIRREYYQLTRSIIDRILQLHAPNPGSGHAIDRHVTTMSLFGMLNWLYRWYDPRKDCAPATLANSICAQFLEGMLGPGLNHDSGTAGGDGEETPALRIKNHCRANTSAHDGTRAARRRRIKTR